MYGRNVFLTVLCSLTAVSLSLCAPATVTPPPGNTPLVLTTGKFTPADANEYDGFGRSVAVSADGTCFVVGAENTLGYGAAYYYKKNGSVWAETKFIESNILPLSSLYGSSVTVSGDGSTFAVGVPYAACSAQTESGMVFVYQFVNSKWYKTILTNPAPFPSQHFGYSLNITPDGTSLVIGTPGEGAGFAYVFTNKGGTNWTQRFQLSMGDPSRVLYGASVAQSPDGNAWMVGAPGTSAGKGASYIWETPGRPGFQTSFVPAAPETPQEAGISVAISSNHNLTVFALKSFNGSAGGLTIIPFEGTAWNFYGSKGTNLYNSSAGDELGNSLCMTPDGMFILAGAYLDDIGANTNQGSAQLYGWNGTIWTNMQIIDTNGAPEDYFGKSVGISDNGRLIVIGIPLDDVGGQLEQGSVYIIELK